MSDPLRPEVYILPLTAAERTALLALLDASALSPTLRPVREMLAGNPLQGPA